MNVQPKKPMSPLIRELYLRIVNDETDPGYLKAITLSLCFLHEYFPAHHLEKALIWLIRSNLIGRRFIQWHFAVAKRSDLEMQRLLLSVVENDVLKPIIAGKNFNA